MHNMAGACSCQGNVTHSSQLNNMITRKSVTVIRCYLEIAFDRILDL